MTSDSLRSEVYSNSIDKDASFHESNFSDSSIHLSFDYHSDAINTRHQAYNYQEPNGFFTKGSTSKGSDLDFTVNLNVSVNEQHDLKNSRYHKKNESSPNNQNNLTGLLDVVHSISSSTVKSVPSLGFKEQKPLLNVKNAKKSLSTEKKTKKRQTKKALYQSKKSNLSDFNNSTCSNCFNLSKVLCTCNLSKLALKKLYKNVIDFNSCYAEPKVEITVLAHQTMNSSFYKVKSDRCKSNSFQNNFDFISNETNGKANYFISYERFLKFEKKMIYF